MARMSNEQWRRHEGAEEVLWETDRNLNQEEILHVLENWNPNAMTNVGKAGAFFTPMELARQLSCFVNKEGRILDMGAGIGRLTYGLKLGNWWSWDDVTEMVALEINPDYLKVGKRLFPEVTWVQGSMFDLDLLRDLGRFDTVVSNPPFGKVPTTRHETGWMRFNGEGSLMAVEVAMRIANRSGTFIMPKNHMPWTDNHEWIKQRRVQERHEIISHFKATGEMIGDLYASDHHYEVPEERLSSEYKKFRDVFPGVDFGSCSLDASLYKWDSVKIGVEITEMDTYDSGIRYELP